MDDEARRAAQAIAYDIGRGDVVSRQDVELRYPDLPDRVWTHLLSMLSDAVRRMRSGDRSAAIGRLAAFGWNYDDERATREAEAAADKAEQRALHRAAIALSIESPPDIADRMTGVGPHGIPLPDDAAPNGDSLATRVATPEALMAFYIAHMRATGWTLDLDASRPRAAAPQCYFSRPDIPGRYVHIWTGPGGVDELGPARLLISEQDDD
ncbi:MAG TPA: hypothetical protein VIH06_13010 [Ilumatobacteraceae bacterium]